MKRMRSAWKLFFLILLLPLFGLANWRSPVRAAPVYQLTPFPTPTPGPDGRIIYVVQPNDTLLRISLIAGISVDELRGLNNLTGENIIVGQELLLGLGGPSQVTPTPGPSPTPTIVVPTPTGEPGSGTLCVLLYLDENGDSIRQEEEPSIEGSAISITGQSAQISLTETTKSGLDPQCFEDLPQDRYTVSVAVPEGYNPTTQSSFVLDLNAGDVSYLDFGAQPNSQTQVDTPVQPVEGGRSPLFGILGALLLLVGAGLALFAGRYLRR
jgi:murein DD-endopeptidase MepM/ murein hydrolase activator NlpD